MIKNVSVIWILIWAVGGREIRTPEALRDRVSQLPGVRDSLRLDHYSGYLNVAANRSLHYWFVESERSPQTDPVIFWFNGGPGCSSLGGALLELGPWIFAEDGTGPHPNPNSWTKFANLVFIETPFGVGFSTLGPNGSKLSAEEMKGPKLGDDMTSADNFAAIQSFYARFPHFHPNPMYLAGESYAGVYLPTLATRIVDNHQRFPVNMKGVLIGNGLLSERLNLETGFEYAYAHGLIDEDSWNRLVECCEGTTSNCTNLDVSESCSQHGTSIYEKIMNMDGLNPYDIYRQCVEVVNGTRARGAEFRTKWLTRRSAMQQRYRKYPKHSIADGIPTLSSHLFYGGVQCIDDMAITEYLHSERVRMALNIPPAAKEWGLCNDDVHVAYDMQYKDMHPFVLRLVAARVPVLIFYGDTDLVCNFLMGQRFVSELSLPKASAPQPWHVKGQLGGFKTVYANGALTYATIHGAGHMAPQWRAPQTRQLIEEFIRNIAIMGRSL